MIELPCYTPGCKAIVIRERKRRDVYCPARKVKRKKARNKKWMAAGGLPRGSRKGEEIVTYRTLHPRRADPMDGLGADYVAMRLSGALVAEPGRAQLNLEPQVIGWREDMG